jgi:phage terminase large subunit-like protein
MYVDEPEYAGLILRRTYKMLAMPDAIMDRAHQWLGPTPAKWNETEKRYTFPSGATLTFGYLDHARDVENYQGSRYQLVGYDELTQFQEAQYRYLFSRQRRAHGSRIPLRMRATSNPGGVGHEWVFERFFVKGAAAGRSFVPALLKDNPHLDQAEYEASLAELDPITRQQLLEGLWVVDRSTRHFRREWWRGRNRYDATDPAYGNRCIARYISWDTGLKDKKTSAYSAAVVLELLPDYRLLVREVWREKLIFPDLVPEIEGLARRYNRDGKLRGVLIEDKASGISAYQTIQETSPAWLREITIPFEPHGDKSQRGQQAAVWCKLDCVLHPAPSERAPWLYDFEAELFAAPEAEYMDQHDAYVQGIIYLEHLLAEGWRARTGAEVA